ncbi:PQQ-dependent sugar dehydrogenase [Shewanella marina]|uniref:PQQ-dependent sugar dehydrogenase n=1 Tax=Shewanella marina TaxID=487319 RepID=UPI0004703D42|nr:PQQ-dependent sugar dehydrogenase [Shewanella marina]
MRQFIGILLISLLIGINQAQAITLISDKFESPWGMAFIDNNNLLISEKHGSIKQLNINTGKVIMLTQLPKVLGAGQGGLMDIQLAPDFEQSQQIYVTYVTSHPQTKQPATTLAKLQYTANNGKQKPSLTQLTPLYYSLADSDKSHHFGSRLAFDKQHIYMTVGDRGHRTSAQDLNQDSGKILRLNFDGSAAQNNPFFGETNKRAAVYSYGHRNQQGISFDKAGQLWTIEHGPRGGDELNLVHKGVNYGWPVISYGREYMSRLPVGTSHQAGMEQPVHYYVPSIAPSDLLISQQNQFYISALSGKQINKLTLDDNNQVINEQVLAKSLNQRIRSLAEDPDGNIYFVTDSGNLYKLTD